jgi:hypothetical protein
MTIEYTTELYNSGNKTECSRLSLNKIPQNPEYPIIGLNDDRPGLSSSFPICGTSDLDVYGTPSCYHLPHNNYSCNGTSNSDNHTHNEKS